LEGGTRSCSPSKVALLDILERLLRRFAPRNARSGFIGDSSPPACHPLAFAQLVIEKITVLKA